MLLRNYNEPLEFTFSSSLTDIPGLALPTLQFDDAESPVKNVVALYYTRPIFFCK